MRPSKCHFRLQNGKTTFPCTRKQNRIESKPEVVGGGAQCLTGYNSLSLATPGVQASLSEAA